MASERKTRAMDMEKWIRFCLHCLPRKQAHGFEIELRYKDGKEQHHHDQNLREKQKKCLLNFTMSLSPCTII